MLWVDKHRPRGLAELDYHKDQAAQLRELVRG
jgi:replication factor C subunit 3/5